jgi:SAM-dependent methyltransferase
MSQFDRSEGRRVFGIDPCGYDRGRPEYPPRVYDHLRDRCNLRPGTATFEIGPGTGQATRHLLRMGAGPLVLIEPNDQLAAYLELDLPRSGASGVTVKRCDFEGVELPADFFDLGVAATSFHWLEQVPSLQKVARSLRSGGWWAAWWNVFGDPQRTDALHEATKSLLSALARSPSAGDPGRPPFALDAEARIADIQSTGQFEDIACETVRWSLRLDLGGVRDLYATFSEIARLIPERRRQLLDNLVRIADDELGGRVEKPMLTPIYMAKRK